MDSPITVTAKRVGIVRAFVGGMPFAVRQGAVAGLRTGMLRILRVVRQDKLNGQLLHKRTGNLSRAVFTTVEDIETDVVGIIGVDLKKAPQGRVQEIGGVIKPVRAQNLTIPLDAAMTGKGVGRFTAREVIANPAAYGFSSTFFKRSARGNTILWGVVTHGTARQAVPLFVLKKSVTIKPVGYLSSAVRETLPAVRSDVAAGIAAALKRMSITSGEAGTE